MWDLRTLSRLNAERCRDKQSITLITKWLVTYTDHKDPMHPVERTAVLETAEELSDYLLEEIRGFDGWDVDKPISAITINQITVEEPAED